MKRLMVAILLIAVAAPLAAQTRIADTRVGYAPVDLDVPEILLEDAVAKGTIPEHAQEAIIQFLELDDFQVADWNQLWDDTKLAAEPYLEQLEEIQSQIEALFEAGNPDPAVIGQLFIDRRVAGEELVTIYRSYVDGFEHGILTVDQHRKYHIVRAADRVQPLIPAFRVYGLLPRR